MARTETPRKRVFNLVGRFEQLAQSSPVQEYIFQSPVSPTSPRPPSQHTERSWLQHDRRSMSLSSRPTVLSLSAKLERELDRNAKLRQEIEDLRDCSEGDVILAMLSQRLEAGAEPQTSLHVSMSGLQTKVDILADNIVRRHKVQEAEYERRIVAVADERDMLASKLQLADADIEQARALEDAVRSADEKARISEEKARVASDQITTLRSQLLKLKTDVATRSRDQVDVSDQEILDMMNKLNYLVQNWCLNTFRKVKIDPCRMASRFERIAALQKAKPLRQLYNTFDTRIKIFTFQATVLYLLMPIFDAHFFGLPEELKGLDSAAWEMESLTAAFNEWRAMTYDLLRNGDDELKKRCQASQAKAQTRIVEQICKTMSALTGTTILEQQKRTLGTLVEHAVSLSQLLGSQRATYRCFLPQANDQNVLKFEISAMENLMDEEESDGVAKDIRCVMSPALIKQSGERGEKMEMENVLVKAKVLCVEEDFDDDSPTE